MCTDAYTKIRDILDDPEGYNGKEVTVAGPAHYVFDHFKVWGRTGMINVNTGDYNGKLPQRGNTIKVTGILRPDERINHSPIAGWSGYTYEYAEIKLESWKYGD